MNPKITAKKNLNNQGKPLSPNAGIAVDFVKPLLELITLMHRDIKNELEKCFKENAYDHAMDGSLPSQARIVLNTLSAKWQNKFNKESKRLSKRMIDRTVNNSAVALNLALKSFGDFESSIYTKQVEDVIKASTTEAANLIRLIPQSYLAEVQGEVMRSITTGRGLADLVPYLTNRYKGNVRHAKLVALDQTRKSFTTINTAKLKALGVDRFIWIHSGGSKEPRKLHQALSGKEFSFDDPPYIGDMYGQRIYGLPSVLPNCRCIYRPVLSFLKEKSTK